MADQRPLVALARHSGRSVPLRAMTFAHDLPAMLRVVVPSMPKVRSQPLLSVRNVAASSRWYQEVLAAQSGHGGDEYERILVDDELLLQLHALNEEHHHGPLADPAIALGNGVAVWFEVDDLDAAVKRSRAIDAAVVIDTHVNPNAGHRELWLRDPDGYLVVLAGE